MKKILFSLLMLCCMTAAWAEPWPPKVYEVGTLEELKEVISHRMANDKCFAEIKLTADIYMSDLGEGESGRHTLCSTFSGTLDGNGHTIWAARPEVQHDGGGHYHRQYLFTNCDGATIKNVTFKDFRVQSEDNLNQAIITSQAKNSCVFENITLDHVSVFCNKDNVGAVSGYTDHCTFTNITVKNSDFTTDQHQSGAVVGHAENCTFTNIWVKNCESTTDDGKSGGMAGHADYCTISDVKVLGTFVWTNSRYGGGVVGFSEHTSLTNCVVDDQSCVWVDGGSNGSLAVEGDAGGIAGYAGNTSIISNCINSALIACDDNEVGGIVGSLHGNMEDCLNTGLIVSISESQVKDYYRKYKNKELPCVTKYYKGKEYVVRKTELPNTGDDYYGGIAGRIAYSFVNRCVNIGSMSGTDYAGGIIGEMYGGDVHNCLCDFETPSDKVMGLVGECDYYERSWLSGCVNMSHAKDYDSEIHVSDIFSYSNNSLDNNELKTGELCHKLRETEACKTWGGAWSQNLGTDAYPIPSGDKGVYHTRTVSNQYGTVCLPYYLEPDDKISYYCIDYNRLRDDLTTLRFKYIEEVRPGLPVLFRVKDFNGTPQEVTFNCERGDLGFENAPYGWDGGYNYWSIGGTFEDKVFTETTEIPSNEVYYVSDGVIKNAKKVTIPAFRGFLYRPDLEKLGYQAKAIQIEIEDEDGTTTALEMVGEDLVPVQKDGKSYSIMGTEVDNNYRGIVIKNGKKVIK